MLEDLTGGFMTRSMFDPTGGDMERDGDTFTPAAADNRSHLPPEATDGKVEDNADTTVPLKGEAGADTLSQADTDSLAQAAQGAVSNPPGKPKAKTTNPDTPPAPDPHASHSPSAHKAA